MALLSVFAICFVLECMNTASGSSHLHVGLCCGRRYRGFAVVLRSGIAGLAICIVLSLVGFRRIGWLTALGILLCIFLGWFLLPKIAVEQLYLRFGAESLARGADIREDLSVRGLETWQTNPIFGVGSGSYIAASILAGGGTNVAHNTFISVLVENGLVGLGIFLSIGVMLLWLIWHMPARQRLLWITVLASLLPAWLAGSMEYQKNTWLIFALIITQAAALRSGKSQERVVGFPGRGVALNPPLPKEHRAC